MPGQTSPPASPADGLAPDHGENLRLLSRSPHPYHRQKRELLHASARLGPTIHDPVPPAVFTKDSTPASDSGTEADDEHFLKGLPAPKTRLHKGLRGKNETLSGSSTPLLPLEPPEEQGLRMPLPKQDAVDKDGRSKGERSRRRKEVFRRSTETLLLASVGGIICSNPDVRLVVRLWRKEFLAQFALVATLLLLYPVRLLFWAYRHRTPSSWVSLSLPPSFDPAPLLYPLLVPLFASLLIAANTSVNSLLPNLILSICSLPRALIPSAQPGELYNQLHWMLSSIPMLVSANGTSEFHSVTNSAHSYITPETGILVYPLHQTLCAILHHLTTTSLLPAELQLLSVSLTDLLLLSTSPQAVILKAALWGAGVGILVTCSSVFRWGIALARVPKWRFRRAPQGLGKQSLLWSLPGLLALRRVQQELLGPTLDDSSQEEDHSSDEGEGRRASLDSAPAEGLIRVSTAPEDHNATAAGHDLSLLVNGAGHLRFPSADGVADSPPRRHTLADLTKDEMRSKTHTPSGRRKRAASSSVRAFFSLTYAQALLRRWLYAGYVYLCVLTIIFLGVREYVGRHALHGAEPVGWALGYLFGDLPWFRLQVVKANLERWVCLPPLGTGVHEACGLGWVEHLRHESLGAANTRLVLSAYWLGVVLFGLAVVSQLSPVYEVDTRRKVFHFMMVAMFLPATFVDPAYAALALSLILALFLLLDLLRASQLPPLSKPIAAFLTPYVDGRDLRGPVVISHIFLLIGCAIPLWLSLAALPRAGDGFLQGWEVPARDVSMVSGVVCVGLGDAAASLIGRRWGVRKWRWGGGKSLEGSAAFALAVFAGLMAAALWLRVGRWPVAGEPTPGLRAWDMGRSTRNAAVCGTLASLTEAVLTGGNDNVVVPIMLWTCVKGLGM